MIDRTSGLGVEIADEKFRTKELLRRARVPTPEGAIADSLEDAACVAEDLGYPVAVKPEVGNHGRGITARVSNLEELGAAFASAQRICHSVIVEQSLTGSDSRMAGIFWDLSYCKFFSHSTIKPPLCMIEGSGYHFLRALLRGDRGWHSRRRRSART